MPPPYFLDFQAAFAPASVAPAARAAAPAAAAAALSVLVLAAPYAAWAFCKALFAALTEELPELEEMAFPAAVVAAAAFFTAVWELLPPLLRLLVALDFQMACAPLSVAPAALAAAPAAAAAARAVSVVAFL